MRPLLLLLVALICPISARAAPEFSGILAMPGQTLFALTDSATAQTEWVALRGRFGGYVVTAYDKSNDTLTLTRDGATLRLRLKDDAKVQASRLELTGSISFGVGEKVEIERATLQFDQENMFPLKDGIVYRITPSRRPDGNVLYRIVIEQRGEGNRMDRLSAPSVVTLPGKSFALRIGDYGFTFTPKAP
jgi:hypothetical protein